MPAKDPNAYAREWRKKNRERHLENQKRWWKSAKGKTAMERRRQKPGHYERVRANNLRKYGLTLAEYDRMEAEQDGRCYICGEREVVQRKPKGGRPNTIAHLSVDHDHETGQVRRLLCNRCNRAIGLFRDNPHLLEKAATYLRSFQETCP